MNAAEYSGVAMLTGPELGAVVPNIATLLERNARLFPKHIVFQELREGKFVGPNWETFVATIRTIAWRLHAYGMRHGDKCAIISPNRLEMLQFELAVMALGATAVPIFAYYRADLLEQLIAFCDARFLAVGGEVQLQRIAPWPQIERVFVFDEVGDDRFAGLTTFSALTEPVREELYVFDTSSAPDSICLMQYTSGTTGKPKCVQISHRNILSQQAALEHVWDVNEHDRLLSYLPWHHSFGGIFELFTSLYRGATMTLEPSYGKDPASILESWKTILPTAFFSVPKIYQALVDMTRSNPETRDMLFHPELKFIFTAAAPLADSIAREFDDRGIRIVEGWGLTETSPCCTITGASTKRVTGVVGFPIPGVSIRIAADGEIQVHGPNVMRGYYNNVEANATAFTDDGWFRTGDIGTMTPGGLRLVGRSDRIFKLSNGEKVVSADVEHVLQNACHYLAFAVVEGVGQSFPVALLFPNRRLLENDGVGMRGCVSPKNLSELSLCLRGCLTDANNGIAPKFSRVPYAILIDDDLSIEKGTLTPSMKVVARNVTTMYKATIEEIYGPDGPTSENVFVVPLAT